MAGVGQRLEMRQGQSLVMTPQLQQAIKLLQLSNVELAEYCEAELEKNPLLERDDREVALIGDAPEASTESAASERADVALSREVSIPDEIQADKVSAAYENGVLTVTLPRREETKAKKINVSVN